ncbi:hypothetical protein [Chryseobacterium indoltheticum]|uniref:Lipoprotein n=1 Tax=Chryseobacterium indoltheticum TaxID=254 RepID=A0A3G6MZP0_9FLAO|nr:hypothetical protein [Chryseobacterium indoltheticum]AZA61004.1 hypothetical protein EG340_08070 [Chryseobacterium indoltheticum]
MRNLIYLIIIFAFTSCTEKKNDYEIINTFFDEHKISVKNLSSEPFYLKEGLEYWKEKEFTDLNFEIIKNEKYKIDTSLVKNKYIDSKSILCKTRISKPLFSKDRKRILLAVDENCGLDQSLTIYLLKKNKGKYVYETDINSTRTYRH